MNGLKILVMLFSNWDNKDKRDSKAGSNTSILEFADGRQVYFVNDWGQSFGGWGQYFGRGNWNCKVYEQQTPLFVAGVKNGLVQFGYGGRHQGLQGRYSRRRCPLAYGVFGTNLGSTDPRSVPSCEGDAAGRGMLYTDFT